MRRTTIYPTQISQVPAGILECLGSRPGHSTPHLALETRRNTAAPCPFLGPCVMAGWDPSPSCAEHLRVNSQGCASCSPHGCRSGRRSRSSNPWMSCPRHWASRCSRPGHRTPGGEGIGARVRSGVGALPQSQESPSPYGSLSSTTDTPRPGQPWGPSLPFHCAPQPCFPRPGPPRPLARLPSLQSVCPRL